MPFFGLEEGSVEDIRQVLEAKNIHIIEQNDGGEYSCFMISEEQYRTAKQVLDYQGIDYKEPVGALF